MKVSSLVTYSCVLLSSYIGAAVAADSGLQIGVIKAVPEEKCLAKTKAGDLISVHYEGTLEDGTVFDSSYKRDQPISFQLGAGQVIPGWDQGLTRMCIGEVRKLTIPSDLAYGDRGIGPIPPKATLIFTAELVDIDGAEKYQEPEESSEEAVEEEVSEEAEPAAEESDEPEADEEAAEDVAHDEL
ncbi:uncharacterized protein RJT20DRAFT_128762 [Scheffersomyces xylosifermentans]|uniref:uncharacterized protein n=1 Tax=Scheffersomyces xylosifermentans TaxID=1304137 RepID=UPI00315D6703